MRPMARRDGLVVRDLADETLVYDRERHQAHCLNRTSAAVFRLCDGTRSLKEIEALLEEGDDPVAREAVVKLALEQLSAARLLVEDAEAGPSTHEGDAAVASRRELLRLAALAVPMIASIVAPTPAQAASAACINASDCTPTNAGVRCDPLNGGDCTTGFPTCCTGALYGCDTVC
jgi:hypothetical protein